nr:MAG TPA: hypothetical protein [Caudoviricetes sp.]
MANFFIEILKPCFSNKSCISDGVYLPASNSLDISKSIDFIFCPYEK